MMRPQLYYPSHLFTPEAYRHKLKRRHFMDNSDTNAFRIEDIWVAFGLLSRLPLPERVWDDTRVPANAAWAYPLVGAVLAGLAGVLGYLLTLAGLPSGFVAAAVLLVFTFLTGAMHEDGLADAADGLWGGFERSRRLEIMKDSHIGAYGVIALIAGFALRWSALTALIGGGYLWAPLLAVAMGSRAAMVFVMASLPNARSTGLSHMTWRPGRAALTAALGLSAVTALICFGAGGLWLLVGGAIAALGCRQLALRKIGGQTGDILGASQQVTEVVLLGLLCAMVL